MATSSKNLLARFGRVIQLLRNVSRTDKGARATTARGLQSQLNYEFLYLLYFFENILAKVNKVSEQVQDTNIDLGGECKEYDSIGRSRTTNPEVRGYVNVYLQLLYRLLSAELEKRFSIDGQHIMRGISAFTPTSEEFLNHAYLRKITSRFDLSPDELKHDIPFVKKLVKEAQTVKDSLVQLFPYKKAFDGIYRLLLIAVTLPVTSASCERTFSIMKIVKI